MKRFVLYRGKRMIAGWPEAIEAAQRIKHYSISGRRYRRIPYGVEKAQWDADEIPCHDCAVLAGELHVPTCDVEECPKCHEQCLGCDCMHDEAYETPKG